MQKPLEGIRVLDLGHFVAGPFSGMLLADMGAEVIRIEKVGGDTERSFLPYKDGKSMFVSIYARNKKCITVNFRDQQGKELLYRLIEKSDVIISNYRAGVMEKMGLGYDKVKQVNPRIIMGSISGFGQKSTYSMRPAFDGVAVAMSGIMHYNSWPDKGPKVVGSPIGDITTGYVNTLAIMMALFQREKTGVGQFIDTAMVDCMVPILSSTIPNVYLEPSANDPSKSKVIAPAGCYKAKDGYIYLAAGTNEQYRSLCELIPNEELKLERYQTIDGRLADYQHLDSLIGAWLSQMTVKQADALLEEKSIPASIVCTIPDLFESDFAKERKQIVWIDMPGAGKIPYAGNPLKLSNCPVEYRPGREVGQDNEDVYCSLLGLSQQQYEAFKEQNII